MLYKEIAVVTGTGSGFGSRRGLTGQVCPVSVKSIKAARVSSLGSFCVFWMLHLSES